MRQKPLIGLLVVVVIAVVFWMIGGAVGSSVMGGEEFEAWRELNFWGYLGMYAGAVVVVSLPLLWFLGRRLAKVFQEQEESAAATRGVGRLAMKAMAGDVAATDHLFDLLENNPLPAIRYQAARGLAMVGRPAVDKELFRQVRYWHADDKMALISTLKTGHEMRVYGLMKLLSEDRNPQVARRARGALVHVMPKTARMDDYAEKIARPRDIRRAADARKAAAARGESAASYPEIPAAAESAAGPEARHGGDPVAAPSAPDEARASMSPEARAARKADRIADTPGKPRRRRAAKKAREAADAPPARALTTEKIGSERATKPADGKKKARPARPSDAAGRETSPQGAGVKRRVPRTRPSSVAGERAEATDSRPASDRPEAVDPDEGTTDTGTDSQA
jgi:hypothetical protein